MIKRNITKLKIFVLILIVILFASVTYAWFTGMNSTTVSAVVDVRAWNIEFTDDSTSVTNSIVITSAEIYPGMETVTEVIEINNFGDADAKLYTYVESARVFEEDLLLTDPVRTSEQIEDALAHEYPFHIDVSLSDTLLPYRTGYSTFEVSISWPLDTGNDALDSQWGLKAYNFAVSENDKLALDSSYEVKNPIEIVIDVIAEQTVESSPEASDRDYRLGDIVLFDVVNNKSCTTISSTCLKTNVIDIDNLLSENTVTLLPDVKSAASLSSYDAYLTTYNSRVASWTVDTRPLEATDVLNIISKDIVNSYIEKENMSDIIIGSVNYDGRSDKKITDTITYGGNFTYSNDKFSSLYTATCVWTNSEYDVDNGFAIGSINTSRSQLYSNNKTNQCKVVPVIIADKTALSTI